MMTVVFVLIKCELGRAAEVACDLVDNVEGVSEMYSTSGQYDLLGKFVVSRDTDVGQYVTTCIQTRRHIRDTFTIITFSPFAPPPR
ncbi:MAG TPA: Lrp/AsnC ligand binding domain-containing protein [Caulobacteraceae bacterium]|nr:Lrp/AsnC ligand binding domain-containing protein [Caulobacteraceae bacterium]